MLNPLCGLLFYCQKIWWDNEQETERRCDPPPRLPNSPHSSPKMTKIKTDKRWLLSWRGRPEELVLCNFGLVRQVESLWGGLVYVFLQKSTLTLFHNALYVPTHDGADQNLRCAKNPTLKTSEICTHYTVQLHQSCVQLWNIPDDKQHKSSPPPGEWIYICWFLKHSKTIIHLQPAPIIHEQSRLICQTCCPCHSAVSFQSEASHCSRCILGSHNAHFSVLVSMKVAWLL